MNIKKMAWRLIVNPVTGLMLGSVLLVSCGAGGAAFKPEPVPAGKGVVYIYRQPKAMGAAVFGTVKANGTAITKIKNGGYFPYVGDPGSTRFSVTTEATNEATVAVEKGKSKYLKTTIGMGVFVGHLKLAEVPPEVGASEITACKRLEATGP